jgi:hemolysin activation/secretion protein
MQYFKCGTASLVLSANLLSASLAAATDNTPTAPKPGAAQTQAAPATFAVWEYRVLGNSKLSEADIERTLYPLLGPDKTFDSVETARLALEKYYHDRGFGTVYVDIPEQEVVDGIVRLRVTEGRLSHVKVTGAKYFANRVILAHVPEATAGSVPDLVALQQELAIVNAQTPDRAVVPVLHAGGTPGTVDLDLKVQDHLPLHGSLELNNARTADTKPLRASASLSYDNVGQRGDSVSLQYQTAPQSPSNVEVLAGTYVFKFPDAALVVYAVSTNSDVATIGTLSVLGSGDIFGTRVVWPITASATRSDSVSFGADYKKFRNTINVATDQTVPTNVDYLPLTLNYNTNLTDAHGTTTLSAGLTWALRGVVSKSSAFENARKDAPTDFFYFRGSASRLQQLPYSFSAQLQFDAQASTSPLIANEQFNVGGVASVRGYFESEELGDSGIRGSFELHSPVLRRPFWNGTQLYGFGFFDWASIELQSALAGQASSTTIRSAGAGFRFNTLSRLDLYFDWAHPLVNGLRTSADISRYNFSVKYGF